MTHELRLKELPFKMISEKSKDIEMRLYDEKRKKINIGDFIKFENVKTKETITVKVINLYRYPSFKELYENFDKIRLGYLKDEIASYKDMEIYYSEEDIKKYGVLGIEIKLI